MYSCCSGCFLCSGPSRRNFYFYFHLTCRSFSPLIVFKMSRNREKQPSHTCFVQPTVQNLNGTTRREIFSHVRRCISTHRLSSSGPGRSLNVFLIETLFELCSSSVWHRWATLAAPYFKIYSGWRPAFPVPTVTLVQTEIAHVY